MADKGLIICFDGPDGVGKTTQLNLVADELKSAGRRIFVTKAVGGNPLTNLLGDALILNADRPPETDLHIALAGQHAIAEDIKTRRDNGEIVLIDRGPLSIAGYQVYGDGLDKAKGYEAIGELIELIQPDLLIIYAADDGTVETRRNHRNGPGQTDHFESKPLEYHKRVAEGFKDAALVFGAKVIDAGKPIETVHTDTMALVNASLKT